MKLTNDAAKALAPLALAIAGLSGKLWDQTRDAYNVARKFYGAGKDASAAVRQAITDAKGNPGSVRGYLSTLAWLTDKGHDTATITMGQATDLRYPKAEKLAPANTAKGIEQREAKLNEAKKAVAEKAEQEAQEDAKDPRRALLRELSTIAGVLSLAALSELVALAHEVGEPAGEQPSSEEQDTAPQAAEA